MGIDARGRPTRKWHIDEGGLPISIIILIIVVILIIMRFAS